MARAIAAFIAAGRVLFGLGLLVAPARVAERWLGQEARRPATIELLRGLGARDVVLGAGALANLNEGGSPAPWLVAAALADGADAVAAVVVGDAIPRAGRGATIVLAGGLAAAGVGLARALH